jgi:hypothetical protein
MKIFLVIKPVAVFELNVIAMLLIIKPVAEFDLFFISFLIIVCLINAKINYKNTKFKSNIKYYFK